jgi:hypothetical protein
MKEWNVKLGAEINNCFMAEENKCARVETN